MVIRCERCSTTYELDEALLSPDGSQVQCTRCQHVFTAYPLRAPGRTLTGVPGTAASEPAGPAAGGANGGNGGNGQRRPTPSRESGGATSPRAVRSGPPPVYRPASGAPSPTGGRAPLLKRDTVGTFESRLRWNARLKWLGPLVGVLAVAGAVAAWVLLARRAEPEPSRARRDAMSLVALDDGASVEQGIGRLDAILRRTPKDRGATADRALAYVLRAAALADEAEGLSARLAALASDRDRLRRDQPAGWEDSERAAASEVQKIEQEARSREERARALGGAAAQSLRQMQSEMGDGPDVARGLAAVHALGSERDRARKAVRAAREKAPPDPWLDLIEAWIDARDPDRASLARAQVHLAALAAAHPEVLRARFLLARTDATLGRRKEAMATLDALLAVNGRHEGAKRLRAELTAPAEPPPQPPPPQPPPKPKRLVVRPAPQGVPPPEAPGEAPAPSSGQGTGEAPGQAPAGPPEARSGPDAPAQDAPPAAAPPPEAPKPRKAPPPPPSQPSIDGG